MAIRIPDEICKLKSTGCPDMVIGFCDVCMNGPNEDNICERGNAVMVYVTKWYETHSGEEE